MHNELYNLKLGWGHNSKAQNSALLNSGLQNSYLQNYGFKILVNSSARILKNIL